MIDTLSVYVDEDRVATVSLSAEGEPVVNGPGKDDVLWTIRYALAKAGPDQMLDYLVDHSGSRMQFVRSKDEQSLPKENSKVPTIKPSPFRNRSKSVSGDSYAKKSAEERQPAPAVATGSSPGHKSTAPSAAQPIVEKVAKQKAQGYPARFRDPPLTPQVKSIFSYFVKEYKEGRDKRGRRYCTDNGKRVTCRGGPQEPAPKPSTAQPDKETGRRQTAEEKESGKRRKAEEKASEKQRKQQQKEGEKKQKEEARATAKQQKAEAKVTAKKQKEEAKQAAKEQADKAAKEAVSKALDAAREISKDPSKATAQQVKIVGDALLTLKLDELKKLKTELGITKGSTKAAIVEGIKKQALDNAAKGKVPGQEQKPKEQKPAEIKPPPAPAQPTPAPAQPVQESTGFNVHPGLSDKGQKALASVAKGIRNNKDLTPEQRTRYAEAAQKVFLNMTDAALDRFNEKLVGEVRVYAKMTDVAGGVAEHLDKVNPENADRLRGADDYAKRMGKALLAGAFVYEKGEGSLHLDGGFEGKAALHRKYERRPIEAHEIYAHEFGHVLDGTDLEVSKSKEWREAFETEIGNQRGVHPINTYASSLAEEGLAEFTRLVYSGDHDHAEIQKKFPRAWQIFESKGWLKPLPQAKTLDLSLEPSGSMMDDIFDIEHRADLGENGHVDAIRIKD